MNLRGNEKEVTWEIGAGIEEERRRLRREIHDQMSPVLAALRLRFDIVRETYADDAGVLEPLDEAIENAGKALADLFAIIDGAFPAELARLGLAGALEELGEYLSISELNILVRQHDSAELSAPCEVAVYRIAAEALTNVVKHSATRKATVSIRRQHDDVVLEVTSSGSGLVRDCHPSYGVGLASMRERAAALGGKCNVHVTDAGMVVRARLPAR